MKINNRGAIPIMFVVFALVVVGALVYSGYITLPAAAISETTGEYIDRPVFKYVKCEQTGSYTNGEISQISSGGQWLPRPSVTDKYDVTLKSPSSMSFAFLRRFEYYVCNSKVFSESNCVVYSNKVQISNYGQEVKIQNVRPSEYVWVQYQQSVTGWSGKDGATYQVGFMPYGLREYNVLAGPSGSIVPNDCTVSNSDQSFLQRIISTDSSKVKSTVKIDSSYSNQLQANELRWYVAGYVSSPAPSFKLTYAGQDAWCKKDGSTASIYKINSLQTGSGTYKIASVEYSDKLGTVTCCPGDKEPGRACSSDYNWVNIQPIDTQGNTKVQCSSFNPCDGGSYTAYGEGTIARYSCVNSICQLQTKAVECANNNDCSSSNQICDTNKWECVDANINIKGQVLDKLADNQQDCEKQGGTWIEEESTKRKWYNYVGIGEPEIVNKKYCEYNQGVPWATLSLILVLAGIVYLFRGQIYSVYRATLGRFLP